MHLPIAAPGWVSLLLASAGFLAPALSVRTEAARRRRDFRHALGAFLDLVVIGLAGGAGVDAALSDAAATGTGWAFTQIRQAIESARLTRVAAWVTLGRLGRELAIDELTELSDSVCLAGTEGARIRASLEAKAAALRARQLNDAEGRAAAATERMGMPVVLLFTGFLIFVGYPAIAQVMTGL
jgi:Flp pilus assembly protein TadB